MEYFSYKNAFEYMDGLVQERRNSSALAMEFHLSCINPSICRLPVGGHFVSGVDVLRLNSMALALKIQRYFFVNFKEH